MTWKWVQICFQKPYVYKIYIQYKKISKILLINFPHEQLENQIKFNVHGSVHLNNILVYNSNKIHKSQSLFYLTIALHVSGVTITHLQEYKTTVTTASGNRYTVLLSYCCLLLSWKSWNGFECVVGDVRHPQHTLTGSNSSTIAADNSTV